MPKPKWKLNTIYISERLQESLRPISRCALTTVVAPMGYGKTTAVNWYLEERAKAGPLRVVRISVYSDNLAIFWRSAQDAFARAGIDLLREYACPTDAAGGGLLADDLCHELAGETPCYLFIDDFHLLTDQRVTAFLCMLAGRLPANVHLIIAGRDRFLPAAEIVRLGARVYRLGTEQLRLNHTELAVYAHRCGTELSDAQVESLLYSSEGWFSAVYLNLRTLSEHGALPERDSDIFTMFTAAMIEPLPQRQQEFLAVMGLADEFTAEMARFVTGDANAEELLAVLTAQNAFVKRLPDGVTYRFHHMMKECAERTFRTLDAETQRRCRERYGAWYEERRQYLHAMAAYRRCGDYDALLRVVQEDAGILLASLPPSEVLAALDECPADALKAHPFALLVLMRSMFNWRNIPRMLELKALLLAALEEHPELPAEERGNLLGECDLIMSFLCYYDISAMSRLHRSASAQMSRPAISIRSSGGWTFGSPSVLMMFYRAPGKLAGELAEMAECMPHYYKITNGHGQGAETIMRAEAAFVQGRCTDAHIALEIRTGVVRQPFAPFLVVHAKFVVPHGRHAAKREVLFPCQRRGGELRIDNRHSPKNVFRLAWICKQFLPARFPDLSVPAGRTAFREHQWIQLEDGHSACQRFRDVFHEKDLAGAGKDVATFLVRVVRRFDSLEHGRHLLDFVQYRPWKAQSHIFGGKRGKLRTHNWVIERNIGKFGENRLEQRCFARLPSAGKQNQSTERPPRHFLNHLFYAPIFHIR